jgi:hypothetical protein
MTEATPTLPHITIWARQLAKRVLLLINEQLVAVIAGVSAAAGASAGVDLRAR